MGAIERAEVEEKNTWDLSPLYKNWDQWRSEFTKLEAELPKLSSYRGKLAQSAEQINSAFRLYLELSRSLDRLYTYAHLHADVDLANSTHQGYLQQAVSLHARLATEASFFTPELLAIDDEVLKTYLENPLLADLRRRLDEIIRYKPHTLSEAEESLLAQGLEVFGSAQRIFSQLNNADLTFGTIEIDGEEKPLTHSTFIVYLKNRDQEIRRKAFEQYYGVFNGHRNTIAASLAASIKKDLYFARARKFESCRARALFSDNVGPEVYDQLLNSISENISPLHRYYELRKKHLQLPTAHLFDTYVPLVSDVNIKHQYKEAVDVICDSLLPLGNEYVMPLREGLTTGRWVDRYENKGKRSGAYHSGCYDSPPYILLNYKEVELGDVFTLTHEAGHAMHTYFSVRNQPYQDHSYTIFVAEVASIFNEELLTKTLKERYADNPRVLAYLVNQQIDDIKATFFRQSMFAEFEKLTHEQAEANAPLTLDYFRETYRGLLTKYFGPSVTFGELDDLECLRIPHFYSAFYVYKYATGLAAAATLAEKVLSGEQEARERYLRFLSSGGSKYPLELLEDAGVDLRSSEPVMATIRLFDSLVTELEGLLEALGS